jgi:hypothetical protein
MRSARKSAATVTLGYKSTLGQMLHQAYQVFQVEVGLGGSIFSQSFISFGRLSTHGFFHSL